ncbi:MAG: sigma-70 family RNA polymerase sigma factor [Kangiellaceae bacterium]|nr:sigma-70 family RNA polymerase sigma factor [Kangiellaceae bacterium]MCW8998084.1 sigma-70 family RNA polymerase sigma factor [Kangiellaceae bacterium]
MNVEKVLQHHYGAALAVLTSKLKSLDLAEESLQEASLKALVKWAEDIPQNPTAWLIKVGYNQAIDTFRKQSREAEFNQQIAFSNEPYASGQYASGQYANGQYASEESQKESESITYEDSILQLIFMCCHPALAQDQQIALTLKMVMGFHTRDIAKAFFIPEKTLEQRITRAKRKIKSAGIELSLPSTSRLKIRLPAVLHTLYLIFNEGYHARSGEQLFNQRLCGQAINLLRTICRMYRAQPDSLALLALMLFIDARSPARGISEVITLEQQDRSLWSHVQIQQADVLLQKSLKMGKVSSYSVQAAIAGLHSMADSFQATDWHQICLLYGKLMQYQPGPVVLLNKAVCHMMLGQYSDARSLLDECAKSLDSYPPFYAANAQFYIETKDPEKAKPVLQKAIELSDSQGEKKYFSEKLKLLEGG